MTNTELNELKGQLIDIFENYLTEKGIASPYEAFIKEKDYDAIGERLINTLTNWQLITVTDSAPETQTKPERSKCMEYRCQDRTCAILGCSCSDVPDNVCVGLQRLQKDD